MKEVIVSILLATFWCFPLMCAKGVPQKDNVKLTRGNEGSDEEWGYVNVRKDAYMFWWLYYSTAKPYSSAPLVLWLQGGPGGSSCGFGNFEEIGPLDVNLRPRNTTRVSLANVLFIDNPVGTGYSYVKNTSALTKNNDEIAKDLVTTITAFFKKFPKFQDIPFYIFSESYGGKMTAGFSKALLKAIEQQQVSCDFKGFAMDDSWISPLVEDLLTSHLSVVVYSGQLDLIVDTMGTERWVQRLTWLGLPEYNNVTWTPLYVESAPSTTAAFLKTLNNFSFYWILNAGHMIPSDQGEMALKMLKMVTGAK